ncbi:MAG: DUF4249 domain-containing protein [Bacteroidota bacterium]
MKLFKNIITIVCLLLLVSCSEDFFDSITEVEIPEHEPRLSVTATFNNNIRKQRVFVNYSVGILDDSPNARRVPDADVRLFEDGVLRNTFTYFSRMDGNSNEEVGWFESDDLEFLPEKEYTLVANSDTYGQATASQQLPTEVPINNLTFKENGAVDIYGDRGNEVTLEINDPAGEENYYSISALVFYRFEDQDTKALIGEPVPVSPVDPILEDLNSGIFLNDASFNGEAFTLRAAVFFEKEEGQLGFNYRRAERIRIVLSSISKDRYLFEKTLSNYYDNRDNPFAEPVIVHENVEGGSGIFTLTTPSEAEINL